MIKEIIKILSIKQKILLIIAIIVGSLSQVMIAYSFSLLSDVFDKSGIISYLPLIKLVFIIILALAFSGFNYIYIGLIEEDICAQIRKKSFENIIHLKSSYIAKKPKGHFYNEILEKINIWRIRYLNSYINIVTSIISLIWVVILISKVDVRINFIIIIFLLPLILNNIIFPQKMMKATNESIKENSNLLEFMRQCIESILIIKNNRNYKNYLHKASQIIDKSKDASKKSGFLANLSAYFANTGVTLSQVSSLIISFIYYIKGYIGFGAFMTFIQLSVYIQEPVIDIINSFVGVYTVRPITANLNNILKIDFEKEDISLDCLNSISIRNLNYSYNSKEDIFKKALNIDFGKYKKYLIKGESGSWKSTLLKILMKYNEDYMGSIKFNDIELRNLNDSDIEKNILYIPQNLYIFNQSIRDNIDPLSVHTDDEILKALNDVNLSYILDENGLDRIIDQDINSISGGEASRLYMAKILLSDKNTVIIDEILSGLDVDNAKNIEKLILNLKNKMVIHIAHNSNIQYEDMYDGKIELK